MQFTVLNAALLQSRLSSLSNDLSCSVFGLAVFVTLSYYCLLARGEIEDSSKVKSMRLVLHALAVQ